MSGAAEAGKPVCRLSVRALVEFTWHESDLGFAGLSRLREGTQAHRARQREGERDGAWRSEVPLSCTYEAEGLTLRVSGRADAIVAGEPPLVEEIKLGAPDAELMPAHRAQAAVYGHMLCLREGLPAVRLRVLYADAEGRPLRAYEEERDAPGLRAEFESLCAAAAAWERKKLERRRLRDESLRALAFPYPAWREGQKRFAAGVWQAIAGGRRLFAQAPTGIGKTMAALWPSLHALPEGKARVVFLTARNTGRRSAMDAAELLEAGGARLLACEIAARDKVCPQERRDCRPEACPMAKGFWDRLPRAAEELMGGGVFDVRRTAELAARHALCPFELSLAAAELADLVVCDYNYVYDPFVSDGRLAQGAVLLVDEAHQLASRVRDARSAEADAEGLRALRREVGRARGRKDPLWRALTGAVRALEDAALQPGFGEADFPLPDGLIRALAALPDAAGAALSDGAGQEARDAFSLGMSWRLASELPRGRVAALSGGSGRSAFAALRLMDAAPEILAVSARAAACAYFSATLGPIAAQRRILGAEEGDLALMLPSPFSPEQLRAEIAPIDVRYAARERTAPQVAAALTAFLSEKPDNALVFFPSYAFLAAVAPLLSRDETGLRLLCERQGMTEEEKRGMLDALDPADPAALLCVLGGAFSEAVDLPGDRLSAVAVVSIGMPRPDGENAARRRYYDAAGEDGWFLTGTLPGITRVVQAAGRLIRSESDRGRLLLIDERFNRRDIRALLEGTLLADALRAADERKERNG